MDHLQTPIPVYSQRLLASGSAITNDGTVKVNTCACCEFVANDTMKFNDATKQMREKRFRCGYHLKNEREIFKQNSQTFAMFLRYPALTR